MKWFLQLEDVLPGKGYTADLAFHVDFYDFGVEHNVRTVRAAMIRLLRGFPMVHKRRRDQ